MRAKKLLTSRQIFRYAVPAHTVTKKALEIGMYYAAIVQWDTTVMVSVSATHARTHQCQQNYHYVQDFILDYVSWSKKISTVIDILMELWNCVGPILISSAVWHRL